MTMAAKMGSVSGVSAAGGEAGCRSNWYALRAHSEQQQRAWRFTSVVSETSVRWCC